MGARWRAKSLVRLLVEGVSRGEAMSNSLYPSHARSPANHMLLDDADLEIARLREAVGLLVEALRDSMDPKHPRPCVSCEHTIRWAEKAKRALDD